MWYGHGHMFHPGGLMFLLLLVGLAVFAFRHRGRRCHGHGHHADSAEAEAILRRRLANGEIGEEEYTRLKGILSK